MSTDERGGFTSKIGVVLATVGAAVGLGNIWRFPYLVGANGGGAFIITYLACVLLLGIPILLMEFYIGRKTGQNPKAAFRTLTGGNRWNWVGWLCLISSILILGFYSVVAGWTAEYLMESIVGGLVDKGSEDLSLMFNEFTNHPIKPLFWLFFVLGSTALISLGGIKDGIEKVSNILMPILFLILLLLAANSLMLDGAKEGLSFMFNPDFSKITPRVFIEALGQAFFSLSIGMGTLITYASYFNKKTNLPKTALLVVGLDTLVALLAGVIIFPIVFTFGISPGQGPELVFITLPNMFNNMFGGQVWSAMFFLLLLVAALTSTIAIAEVVVTLIHEEYNISRKRATFFVLFVCSILGVVCSLSLGVWREFTIFGMNIFGLSEYVAASILQPIGGAAIAIYGGWLVSKKLIKEELSIGSKISDQQFNLFYLTLKYVAPIGVLVIILQQFGIL
ncbi:MAG: sodium-dependent transporter [Bacteroidales bacterium]